MKATMNIAPKKMNTSAKHNDRNFDVDNSEHIDNERMKDNFYINRYNDDTMTFEECEKRYYQENYSEALEAQNKKHLERRQKNRVKTIDDLLKDKNTKVDEMILQIGNKDDSIDKETFRECINTFNEKIAKQYKNFHVLNIAVHNDETTTHAHLRFVLDYTDENGFKRIGTTKALEEMKIELPKPDQKVSRYNNRKVTFTEEVRKIWHDVIKEHDIELDEEVKNPSQKHIKTLDYKVQQSERQLEVNKKKIKEQEEQIKAQEEQIAENANIANFKKVVDDTITALEEQRRTNQKYGNFANAVIQVIHSFCEHYKVKSSDMKKEEQQKSNTSYNNEIR